VKLLYIFSHPDDESFGPAAGIHQQIKSGHEVYLLTLSKGGATKERYKLNLSIEEMGEVRYNEMLCVEKTLGLSGMKVLDFPDGGMAELDPRTLEKAIAAHIEEIKPAVVITYAIHGVSGHRDHLATHASVKRAFVELRDNGADYLKRLAFFTLHKEINAGAIERLRLNGSDESKIGCMLQLSEEDKTALMDALKCYETYQDVIAHHGVANTVNRKLFFEIFGETYETKLTGLTEGI
jgi:N-acetylglucosamine malate deacetylase 2